MAALTDELALVDTNPDKLHVEMLDLQHAVAFLPRSRVSCLAGLRRHRQLCRLCCHLRAAPCRSAVRRLGFNLLQRNLALFKVIVQPLAAHSPEALLRVVSNPVDVLHLHRVEAAAVSPTCGNCKRYQSRLLALRVPPRRPPRGQCAKCAGAELILPKIGFNSISCRILNCREFFRPT